MKSRQMKVNVKLIWPAANMRCSAQIRLDSRPIRGDRVQVAENRLGTQRGPGMKRLAVYRNYLEVWRGWVLRARILGSCWAAPCVRSAANEKI
jgi:hypothetical protein